MHESPRTLVAALVALAALSGCSEVGLIDFATRAAHHPVVERRSVRGYQLLAGDMHCHVRPPDADGDVARELPETVELAREEGLDFVVLSPHVRARFFERRDERDWVIREHAAFRARVAALPDDIVFVPGFEYTDHRWGHTNGSFADIGEVLRDLPADEAREHPERFFERFVARGGVLVINHPAYTPIESPFRATRSNISWRAFFGQTPPVEMVTVGRLAHGIEIFNLPITHIRDGLLLHDEERSLRLSSIFADRVSRERGGPVAAVGGSDSHGHHLRATTFVLARARSRDAIREAIVAGRTCARDPAACTFEVSADGERWVGVGDSLAAPSGTIRARAAGDDVTYFVNGVAAAGPTLSVSPCACSIVRARVGKGWSSGVRVNCGSSLTLKN